jgi:glutaredoxin
MAGIIQSTLDAAGPEGVVLFSKSYCPFCKRAIKGLMDIGISPVVVELDQRKDGNEIQAALLKKTGQRTVPSAWLRGEHIGGSDDVANSIRQGLFDAVPKAKAKEYAEGSGIQKCGAEDGLPCLCYE